MPIDKKQKRLFNIAIQAIIILLLAYFFYQKFEHEELMLSIKSLKDSFSDHIFLWSMVLFLMPVNWGLESYKWKKLCKPIFDISLGTAIKGVITGISVSFVTPHGWGDYLGRIMVLTEQDRERLVGALFFGKMAQLFITVIAGIIGLVMYFEVWPYLYLWYFISFILVGLLVLFNRTLYNLVRPYLSRLRKYFSIVKKYNTRDTVEILVISGVRYGVFALQFMLIMIISGVDLSLMLIFGGITWIFLVKSIIPSFNFLSDLGIREVSAIMFFETYLFDVSPVVSATLIIWIINILFPAILGTAFVFTIKTFR